MTTPDQLVTDFYMQNKQALCAYIARRIPHPYMAEDMAQDVFLRLWNIRLTVCAETIKSLFYTVATNLVTDYLRRCGKRTDYDAYYMYYGEHASNQTEERVVADSIAEQEWRIVESMPKKRRQIYIMSRYEDKTIDEIVERLGANRRTVETHLFIGRKELREEMKHCI